MWNRRRTLQTGLATLLSAAAPLRAFSQPKPRVKVRYNEVVRSMLYTPAYVAIAKGYFDELGMDVTLATAQGGDKSVAIMLSNQADIGLMLIGRHYAEDTIYRAAAAFEQSGDWTTF